ncbi:MAG: sulfatase [Candidatus Fermentibacteraceae bacterium]|nr:sulfatase [Candidatus Fermentibacteraceae bacterium]
MARNYGVNFVIVLLILVFSSCIDSQDNWVVSRSQIGSQRNVILIILDTLRADHLSCYGYYRNTSPSIDSLAAEGTMWANAQAQAPWTLPAHATIWTGLSVESHGTNNPLAVYADDDEVVKLIYTLDSNLPTMPELFSEAGFSTRGIANFTILSEVYGFDSGFDEYSCHPDGEGRAGISVDSLILWLDDHSDENFFCMMHLYDIHSPYNPPVPYNTAYQDDSETEYFDWEIDGSDILNEDGRDLAIDLYDGEIKWVDDNLGRLFGWLRENHLEGETLVVIMADHGEEFLEHGWVLHGSTLYQEVLRVPLIMSGPGVEKNVIDSTFVGQFDVLPTLLTWAGVEHTCNFDGTDILNGFNEDRVIPSSGTSNLSWRESRYKATTVHGYLKTLMSGDLEEFVTYDLFTDPSEQHPLPGDSAGIEEVLYYWASPQIGTPGFAHTDERTEQILHDLGYI